MQPTPIGFFPSSESHLNSKAKHFENQVREPTFKKKTTIKNFIAHSRNFVVLKASTSIQT
jgi:hypothetical protein